MFEDLLFSEQQKEYSFTNHNIIDNCLYFYYFQGSKPERYSSINLLNIDISDIMSIEDKEINNNIYYIIQLNKNINIDETEEIINQIALIAEQEWRYHHTQYSLIYNDICIELPLEVKNYFNNLIDKYQIIENILLPNIIYPEYLKNNNLELTKFEEEINKLDDNQLRYIRAYFSTYSEDYNYDFYHYQKTMNDEFLKRKINTTIDDKLGDMLRILKLKKNKEQKNETD